MNKQENESKISETDMDQVKYQEADELADRYDDYDDEDYDEDDIYDFTPEPETSRGAWTSLVLGIMATVGWIVPIIGVPITIVGIVLGAINLKSRKAKGAAISGFVINIVFLLAAIAKGIVDIVKLCKKK